MNQERMKSHVPIIAPSGERRVLDFSHFNYDARAGLWRKERVFALDSVKINVFLEGAFSVFSDGVLHRPTYGDICFLPPFKLHYGQIKEPMHVNYYQLNIACDAFASVPDGACLLGRLIDLMAERDSFVRPSQEKRETVLRLCREIEESIDKEERFLAYAKVIEFLSTLYPLFLSSEKTATSAFSLHTAKALRYLETHYAERVTLKTLSDAFHVSESFLARVFKKETGMTLHEYLNRYRILKAKELLPDRSVTEVGYLCGFCDSSHFISVFKKYTQITPTEYKSLRT